MVTDMNGGNNKSKNQIFVLDTNVLLNDPEIIQKLHGAEIIIPQTVLLELDKVKMSRSDVDTRFRGRAVARKLFELTKLGKISDGIKINDDTTLKVLIPEPTGEVPPAIKSKSSDDQILALSYHLNSMDNKRVTLITSDLNMLVKAQAIGLDIRHYEPKDYKKTFSILKSKRWQKRLFVAFIILLLVFLSLPRLIELRDQPQTPTDIFHQRQVSLLNTLKSNPNNIGALIGLGDMYFEAKMWNEASKLYARALAINPSNWNVKANLAITLFNVGNKDEAISILRSITKDNPKHSMAHFNLGAMLSQLSERKVLSEAINHYQAYLKLEPSGRYSSEAKSNIIRIQQTLQKKE